MIGLDLGRISEVVSSGGQEEQPMVKQKALRQLRLMHIGLRESQPLFVVHIQSSASPPGRRAQPGHSPSRRAMLGKRRLAIKISVLESS